MQDMESYFHKRELTAWFRLSHPNILPFLGCCITSAVPMFLTPLAEDGDARTYRAAHPEEDWLQIVSPELARKDYASTEYLGTPS